MKTFCANCSREKAHYLADKPVCLKCDELLFDIEIECEELASDFEKTEKFEIQKPTSRAPRR